jgi:hypothetical protein
MPAHFESLGISFQYPENWRLDDSDALLGRRSVTIYSPGGAFWSVAVHPGSAHPKKITKAIVDALRKEYDSVEVEEIEEKVGNRSLRGYDIAFYCLDLTNTAKIRSVYDDSYVYTVYWQAEDREFDALTHVFDAITLTFVNGLSQHTSSEGE